VIWAFAHHAEQGLRPREAHKDAPACLCKGRLRLTDGCLQFRLREEPLPLPWGYWHGSLELRIERDSISHLPNRDPRTGDQPEHGDRTEETVTRWRELREEEVATLLATESTLASGESFGNVSVADGGALKGDSVGRKVALYAAIGQHRGDGTVRSGDSSPLPIQRNEGN
jgi:hypothetical protein